MAINFFTSSAFAAGRRLTLRITRPHTTNQTFNLADGIRASCGSGCMRLLDAARQRLWDYFEFYRVGFVKLSAATAKRAP